MLVNYYFCTAGRLIAVRFCGGRKVRTPQGSIADNIRRSPLWRGKGQVQQKAGTGNAVVKPGKLYAVKFQVYRHSRMARPLPKGRKMELVGNFKPR